MTKRAIKSRQSLKRVVGKDSKAQTRLIWVQEQQIAALKAELAQALEELAELKSNMIVDVVDMETGQVTRARME